MSSPKKRLTELTPAQRDRMSSFAQEWIDYGWRTTPLTEEEWAVWEAGARKCYEFAGVPWPGIVIRVSSPMVGAFAAPLAAIAISLHRHLPEALAKALSALKLPADDSAVDSAVRSAVRSAVDSAVYSAVDSAVRSAVYSAVGSAVGSAVDSAVRSAVDSAVDSAVYSAVDSAVGSAVDSAVDSAVRSAVGSAVYSAVRSAVRSAVGSAVDSAVGSAVGSAVDSAVRSAVDSAVYSAVDSAVGSAVRSAVDSAVRSAVDSAVYSAVYSAVRSAVRSAVYSAVDSAVDSAVRSAVYSAVYSAVDSAKIKPFWHNWFGGRQWCYWPAFVAYFRDVVELNLDGDTWDRSKAYEDAQSAGYWWPNRDFVMVCDAPAVLHVESASGAHRLHREDGPAVAWSDGWGLYSWHGTRVPSDLIETGWDVEKIMAESNTEVRRCAIEKMGWDQFVTAAGMNLTDEAEDPGNPGQVLRLYDVPRDVLEWPVRVLVAHNATRERDGSRHTFGLTVPIDCRTAVMAAAWTFDLTEKQYAGLARAT